MLKNFVLLMRTSGDEKHLPIDIGAVEIGVTITGMTTDGQEEQVMNGDIHDADDAPHEIEEDTVAMVEELSPQAMQSSPSPGCKSNEASCICGILPFYSLFKNNTYR
jgi:hypothetical protein